MPSHRPSPVPGPTTEVADPPVWVGSSPKALVLDEVIGTPLEEQG